MMMQFRKGNWQQRWNVLNTEPEWAGPKVCVWTLRHRGREQGSGELHTLGSQWADQHGKFPSTMPDTLPCRCAKLGALHLRMTVLNSARKKLCQIYWVYRILIKKCNKWMHFFCYTSQSPIIQNLKNSGAAPWVWQWGYWISSLGDGVTMKIFLGVGDCGHNQSDTLWSF